MLCCRQSRACQRSGAVLARYEAPSARVKGDLPFKRVILASQPPGIGKCRVIGQDRDFVGVQLLAIFVSELGWLAAEMLDQFDDEGAGAGGRVEDLDIPVDQLSAEILIKSTFRMSRSAAAGSHAAGTPGHAPGGCAGRCVPGQSAR